MKVFFSVPYTIFFSFLGSFVSDWLYYIIGRLNGKLFIEKRPKLRSKIEPVIKFFQKNKIQILFTYRFLYGFRVIIPLIIGMSNIRPLQFLGYSIIAGLLWSSLVTLMGYFVGRIFGVSIESFENNLVLILVGFASFGLLIGYTVQLFAKRQMNLRANQ
ncbi:DedA family protein [Chryseosolibacter indicus]|uniref:DedA family protein n=1 Tax=Chryseosolibacter indicus TaxID=2782351 RepID=A0ABS5VPZ8_9BACT|nr:DedA family protein [Chryseosolibacter indicus]